MEVLLDNRQGWWFGGWLLVGLAGAAILIYEGGTGAGVGKQGGPLSFSICMLYAVLIPTFMKERDGVRVSRWCQGLHGRYS